MATPVTVNIPHHLGKAEARRRIAEGFGSVEQSMSGGLMGIFSFQKRWENDTLHFEGGVLGQNLSGRVDVLEDSVQVQINLPDLLASLAGQMKESLQKQTKRLLEKK